MLNKEEFVSGSVIALAWFMFTGVWTWLTVPAIGLLWALGGSVDKAYRRYGVPVLLVLCILLAKGNAWVADDCSEVVFLLLGSAVGLYAVLCIGYGMPTWDQNDVKVDEGSWLGNICYKLVKGEPHWWAVRSQSRATMLCRGVVGVLIGLVLLPLAGVDFTGWLVASIICAIGYPLMVKAIE